MRFLKKTQDGPPLQLLFRVLKVFWSLEQISDEKTFMNAKCFPKSTGSGVQKKIPLKFFSTAFENEAQCSCQLLYPFKYWGVFKTGNVTSHISEPVISLDLAFYHKLDKLGWCLSGMQTLCIVYVSRMLTYVQTYVQLIQERHPTDSVSCSLHCSHLWLPSHHVFHWL